MTLLERVPAVRRIDTDRSDACAFELAGHLTAADVENLYGLLEAAYLIEDRIDLLLRFVDYEGVDWEAVFSSDGARAGREADRHIRRTAIVGGPEWLATATGFLAPFVSLEMRRFEAGQEAEAWAYIEARPQS